MSTTRPPLPPGPYLVVGLGRSGTAIAALLAARGERVIAVDADTPAVDLPGVDVRLGTDGVDALPDVRTVVKSPGVPREHPAVAQADREVVGELELAWRLLPNDTIAITGTNGKTTTTEWIGHLHRVAGAPVAVAGNVGTALSSLVGAVATDATIVCEASSFQLEDAPAFAPDAAVLLNITPDHLDRHGSFDAYRAAKLSMFTHQAADQLAILPAAGLGVPAAGSGVPAAGPELPGAARRVRFGGPDGDLALRGGGLWWEGERLVGADELPLPGAHNVENAMATAATCLARGLSPQAVRDGLLTFAGVPHRLQTVGVHAGVRFVNDSKATNVSSTLVALSALPDPIHLILGGRGKGQSFAPLADAIARHCRAVYLIGEDAERIAAALHGCAVPLERCGDLERALTRARGRARAGDVVLLSPACASFDQFEDFERRGERFRELVG